MPFPHADNRAPFLRETIIEFGRARARRTLDAKVTLHPGAHIQTRAAAVAIDIARERPDSLVEEVEQRDLVFRADVCTGAATETHTPVNDV